MIYKIVRCILKDNGEIIEGKRKETFVYPTALEKGGLYFLRPNKLYRVIEVVKPQCLHDAP